MSQSACFSAFAKGAWSVLTELVELADSKELLEDIGVGPLEDFINYHVSDYIAENGKDVFNQTDINRLQNEDFYVQRFFMHMWDVAGVQEDNAVNMVINSFKWRKETDVENITVDTLNENLKNKGSLDLLKKSYIYHCYRH